MIDIRGVAITLGLAILIPLTFDVGFYVFMELSQSIIFAGPVPSFKEALKAQREVRELEGRISELEEKKRFDEAKVLKKQLEGADAAYQELKKPYKEAITRNYSYEKFYSPVAIMLGAALMITSFFVPIIFLGAGLLVGGVACINIGIVRHWHIMDAYLQFFILLGVIVALIILGKRFFVRRRRQL